MRTDGQTDTTKLIVAFRNFENAPKIILCGRFTCVYMMVRLQTMNKLRHGRTAVDDTSHCTSTDWSDYNVRSKCVKRAGSGRIVRKLTADRKSATVYQATCYNVAVEIFEKRNRAIAQGSKAI